MTIALPGDPDPRWEAWAGAYLRISGQLLRVFSIVVLVTMVGLNAANVAARVFFHVDFEWTEELMMIAAMGIYFLSVALITKGNMDIRIDAIVRVLPQSWHGGLGMIARLSVLVFQGIVLWLAIDTIGFVSVFHTPVLELSESVFYVPVIAGAADMVITEAIFVARQVRGSIGPPGSGLLD